MCVLVSPVYIINSISVEYFPLIKNKHKNELTQTNELTMKMHIECKEDRKERKKLAEGWNEWFNG